MRLSTAIRAAAVTVLAAGVAAPLVRRRLRLPPPVVTATAAAAPFALCVLYPRSRARDGGDVRAADVGLRGHVPDAQRRSGGARARACASPTPYARTASSAAARRRRSGSSARSATRAASARWEKALVWSHWLWFLFPHGTVAYLLLRHPERFARGAAQIYATFDLGLVGYWGVPTAPPWYAAGQGLMDDGLTPELRRMMVEYGEEFWGSGWGPLYGFLGGNPLAAMPSLHFATSVMAAHLLAETGPVAGAVGWAYAGTLGVALVYLGEHYVVDLAAGLALAEGIRRAAPAAVAADRARLGGRAGAGGAGARMTGAAGQWVRSRIHR